MDFKTCFAYYVLQNLTLDDYNLKRGKQLIAEILSDFNRCCEKFMRETYVKIFTGHVIVNKFYVFSSNSEHLRHIFPPFELKKKSVQSENLGRTQYYSYSDEKGIYWKSVANGLAKASIAPHGGPRYCY